MGLKLSSLFSKKKTKKQKRIEYSLRTAQKIDNERRTGKLIYPPLSSIPKEEPKRFLTPDGRPIYEPIYMDSDLDENNHKYQDERYRVTPHFVNNYTQYDDGTFAVLSRQSMNDCNIYRI